MAEAITLIIKQLDRMEANQEKTTEQLSCINTRLAVVEHDVKELHRRLNFSNGCTGQLAEEIDDLQVAVEKLEERKWTRGDKIRAVGIALSGILALAALIVTIICH